MIRLLRRGDYRVGETLEKNRVLVLDNHVAYTWHFGHPKPSLRWIDQRPQVAKVLFEGKYRLCEVREEDHLTAVPHLELSIGKGIWQSYLLPAGLPIKLGKHYTIIPTSEIITKATVLHAIH